jgi:hypothetical protein
MLLGLKRDWFTDSPSIAKLAVCSVANARPGLQTCPAEIYLELLETIDPKLQLLDRY